MGVACDNHLGQDLTFRDGLLVRQMNIATTKGQSKSLSLPNILTYARIAAIPVVVGCVYVQSVMDGPLWLRWVALTVFIAAGVTDVLDGYYARMWDQQSAFGRMLDPIADKLLVASCLLMLAADNSIMAGRCGRHRDPVPRDPGVGLAGISRRAAGQRSRDQACEMEDHHPAGCDRLPIAGEAGERILSATT